MTRWSDGFVNTNGITIHYYRTGGDKPQVVINHGAGDDGLCWTRVVKELERDYDVILPDARGHGMSSSGKGDYSTPARLADLVGLMRELKLERPVVGGHSMGADTSMNLAAEHPELARAVFLEDPPVILPGETFGDGTHTLKAEDVGKTMARFLMLFRVLPKFIGLPLGRKFSPTYPDDEIIPWEDSKKRVSFDFLNSMPKLKFDAASPFDVLRRINVPLMLFIGDKKKMSIMSEAAAQKAVEANPRLQVVHLEGASHDIRRTRFDGYLPALEKFLKETA